MTVRRDPNRRVTHRRRGTLAAAPAAALLLTACGGGVAASGDVQMGPAEGDAIEVVALDDEFDPATLELDAGSEVTVEVTNRGERPHNLVVDDLELSTGTLEPGDVATVTFTVPESAVTYRCSFHRGMDGELTPTT